MGTEGPNDPIFQSTSVRISWVVWWSKQPDTIQTAHTVPVWFFSNIFPATVLRFSEVYVNCDIEQLTCIGDAAYMVG